MVFLPECCDYIAESTERTLGLAETINGEVMEKYKELSKKFNMWVSVGSFHQKVGLLYFYLFTYLNFITDLVILKDQNRFQIYEIGTEFFPYSLYKLISPLESATPMSL